MAFGVAETGPLAENLGSTQSNLSLPHVAGVGDRVAHPIEEDRNDVKPSSPSREARGELAKCIRLPIDDIAGREKLSTSEGSHCEPG